MMITPMALEGYDQWIGFVFGILLSLVVQGEGQEFFVLLFQPLSERKRVAYDLNPLHHFDFLAAPVLILAGWGWGRKTVVEPPYFPDSPICRGLTPLSGALASILLAGILASIHMFIPFSALETAIKFSVLMAVANLIIPIPPLGLGRAVCASLKVADSNRERMERGGAVMIIAMVLLENFLDWPLLQAWVGLFAPGISKWIISP
jgi:hypothetical protein